MVAADGHRARRRRRRRGDALHRAGDAHLVGGARHRRVEGDRRDVARPRRSGNGSRTTPARRRSRSSRCARARRAGRSRRSRRRARRRRTPRGRPRSSRRSTRSRSSRSVGQHQSVPQLFLMRKAPSPGGGTPGSWTPSSRRPTPRRRRGGSARRPRRCSTRRWSLPVAPRVHAIAASTPPYVETAHLTAALSRGPLRCGRKRISWTCRTARRYGGRPAGVRMRIGVRALQHRPLPAGEVRRRELARRPPLVDEPRGHVVGEVVLGEVERRALGRHEGGLERAGGRHDPAGAELVLRAHRGDAPLRCAGRSWAAKGPADSHGGAPAAAAGPAAAPAAGRPPDSATSDVSATATRSHARAGLLIRGLDSVVGTDSPLLSPGSRGEVKRRFSRRRVAS